VHQHLRHWLFVAAVEIIWFHIVVSHEIIERIQQKKGDFWFQS
jgi:hypothetical protein